ncbi:MAG: twin-arginine translocase subunit TatC [Micavibrio sp.]
MRAAAQTEQAQKEQAGATLAAHLAELRRRILWCLLALAAGTGICYLMREPIYAFLITPLADAMGDEGTRRLIFTGLPEMFFTYLRIAFFAGCFLTFPFILWQVWIFVAPALYKNEKRVFVPYLIATPVLFFLGGALVYYLLMPLAWKFFLSFQSTAAETVLPIQLEPRVGEYLDIVMTLIFAFGLSFQLPVLLTLLGRAGLIRSATLKKGRKYAIVGVFAFAAIVTPPDVFSQIALAIPLYGLYEISVFLIARMERARLAQGGADD